MTSSYGLLGRALLVAGILTMAAAGCSDDGGSVDTDAAGDSSTTSDPTDTTAPTSDTIGYVGCSNTRGAVVGAHAVGDTRLWPELPYGGGTIVKWNDELTSPDKGYWQAFERQLALEPTNVFWVQLCVRPPHRDQDIYDSTIAVIEEIRRLVPDATVYLSAMNGYVAPHVCSIIGEDGTERMEATVDRVVDEGVALRGPDVGDLISADNPASAGASAAETETKPDGCHPDETGEAKLGAALNAFPAFSD